MTVSFNEIYLDTVDYSFNSAVDSNLQSSYIVLDKRYTDCISA